LEYSLGKMQVKITMKNRTRLILFAIVAFIVVLLFWRLPIRHAIPPMRTQTTAQSSNVLASNTNVVKSTATIPSTNVAAEKLKASSAKNPALLEPKAIQIQQILEGRNVPINFYGKVIDQDGNDLPNVHIRLNVQQPYFVPATYSTEANYQKLERITDSKGYFSLENVKGASLAIESVEKEGYRLSSKTKNIYAYGDAPQPHHPDSQNPVIIKMWKLGEKAQLITGNKFWGIVPDGRVYTMDFIRQIKLESDNASGDIRFRMMRPAQVKPREKFDWSFEIEGVQGGVIQTQDDFMYLAPETGYQSKYEFSMSTNNPSWKREMDGMQFYFQSRNGSVYGQFTVDIIPDYNEQSIFNVKFSANFSGSRSLQP